MAFVSGTATFLPASASSSGSITIPGTAASGDVGLLVLGLNSGSATLTTPPSGWTLVGSLVANNSSQRAALYKRTLTSSGAGSPGSSVSFTWSATGHIHAFMVTAPSPTGDIDAATVWNDNTADTSMDVPAHTPGVDNANCLALVDSRSSTSPVTLTATFPSGWTEDLDAQSAWTSGITNGAHAAEQTLTTTAGTPLAAGTGTFSTSVTGVGWVVSIPPAGATNVNGDVASSSTATLTTGGVVGAVAGAALAATVALTAAGVVGTSTGSSVPATDTITAAGAVGTSTGAAISGTGTITAAGVVGKSSGASLAATDTITAAGTVTAGGASGATLAETATVTTSGQVGKQTGATLAATATLTAAGTVTAGGTGSATLAATDAITTAGRVGTATQTTLTATASITAAGRLGLSSGASLTATFTVTADGTKTGDHVVADAARLELVTPENRTPAALTEQRTPAVATENRHQQVPAETRTTAV